eukprot:scaffold10_cov257-Pinguiococcus_pyrenoidosus.AAC.17
MEATDSPSGPQDRPLKLGRSSAALRVAWLRGRLPASCERLAGSLWQIWPASERVLSGDDAELERPMHIELRTGLQSQPPPASSDGKPSEPPEHAALGAGFSAPRDTELSARGEAEPRVARDSVAGCVRRTKTPRDEATRTPPSVAAVDHGFSGSDLASQHVVNLFAQLPRECQLNLPKLGHVQSFSPHTILRPATLLQRIPSFLPRTTLKRTNGNLGVPDEGIPADEVPAPQPDLNGLERVGHVDVERLIPSWRKSLLCNTGSNAAHVAHQLQVWIAGTVLVRGEQLAGPQYFHLEGPLLAGDPPAVQELQMARPVRHNTEAKREVRLKRGRRGTMIQREWNSQMRTPAHAVRKKGRAREAPPALPQRQEGGAQRSRHIETELSHRFVATIAYRRGNASCTKSARWRRPRPLRSASAGGSSAEILPRGRAGLAAASAAQKAAVEILEPLAALEPCRIRYEAEELEADGLNGSKRRRHWPRSEAALSASHGPDSKSDVAFLRLCSWRVAARASPRLHGSEVLRAIPSRSNGCEGPRVSASKHRRFSPTSARALASLWPLSSSASRAWPANDPSGLRRLSSASTICQSAPSSPSSRQIRCLDPESSPRRLPRALWVLSQRGCRSGGNRGALALAGTSRRPEADERARAGGPPASALSFETCTAACGRYSPRRRIAVLRRWRRCETAPGTLCASLVWQRQSPVVFRLPTHGGRTRSLSGASPTCRGVAKPHAGAVAASSQCISGSSPACGAPFGIETDTRGRDTGRRLFFEPIPGDSASAALSRLVSASCVCSSCGTAGEPASPARPPGSQLPSARGETGHAIAADADRERTGERLLDQASARCPSPSPAVFVCPAPFACRRA